MCIERFNIADVARIHGVRIIRERNGEIYAVCPFCGNDRGKFSYIVKKGKRQNIYHCFSCDAGGTAIDMHMKLSNNDYSGADGYKKAALDIFRSINGDSTLENHHKQAEEKAQKYETEDNMERASDGQCSAVYYAMLNNLTLRDEHKEDLLKRGLTEEDIKRFRFRSTPQNGFFVCKKLIAKDYKMDGCPGFYVDKKNWDMSIPAKGYFCPAFDGEMNFITGFQIRVDNPTKKFGKYLWFSSSGKNCGVTSGALSTYLPGENDRCIIITEGILKAIVIYCLLGGKVTVIGVPGIGNIASLECFLSRYENNAYAIIAYDMDNRYRVSDVPLLQKAEKIAKSENLSLDEVFEKEEYKEEFRELKKTKKRANARDLLIKKVEEYNIGVHSLTWDTTKDGYWNGNYKGLDDFLRDYPQKDKFLSYILAKAQTTLNMKSYFEECK